MFFQTSDELLHFRQFGQDRLHLEPIPDRHGIISGNDLSSLHIPGYTRPSAGHDPIADHGVVGYTDLAAEHDIAADGRASGDPHLASDKAVLADRDVVGNMHLVVELGAFPDQRVPQRGTVDGAVSADLNVIFDNDPSDLGDFMVPAAVGHKTESIAAEHGACMNNDPFADRHPVPDTDLRMDHGVVINEGTFSDEHSRMERNAIADPRAVSNGYEGMDRRIFADKNVLSDRGFVADASGSIGRNVEQCERLCKSEFGVLDPQKRQLYRRRIKRRECRRCPGSGKVLEVLLSRNKGDASGRCVKKTGNCRDLDVIGTIQLARLQQGPGLSVSWSIPVQQQ